MLHVYADLTLECLNSFKKKSNFCLLNTCSSDRPKKEKIPQQLNHAEKTPIHICMNFFCSLSSGHTLSQISPLNSLIICG